MGSISRHYERIAVAAVQDEDKLQSLVGEYDLNQACPYPPEKAEDPLAGMILRVPDIQPENTLGQVKARMKQAAQEECCLAAGARYAQNFKLQADYSNFQWEQLLLPMYCTYYTDDDGQARPVIINGQTGKIGGQRLASQKKARQLAILILICGLAIFMVGAVLRIILATEPLFSLLGIFLLIVGLGVAVSALVPALYPLRWNRMSLEERSSG
jgi:hypothetical protein